MLSWRHAHHDFWTQLSIKCSIKANFNHQSESEGKRVEKQVKQIKRSKGTGGEGWRWHHAFRAEAGPQASAEYTPNSLVYFP